MYVTVGNATCTAVTVGATSTSVLAANARRVGFILTNDSTEDIYVTLGSTATMNSGLLLKANGGSMSDAAFGFQYTGPISAICSSGSKNLLVTHYQL